jgi:hypothetical protein
MRVNANNVLRVNLMGGINTGFILTTRSDNIAGPVDLHIPSAAMVSPEEWRMWTDGPCLNEFGHLYVALHIAGNYARYYPDKWLHDVEHSTPLALAIEELCSLAQWRAPWLTFCELDQTLYVNEA